MRTVLLLIGIILVLMGVGWIGQGTGYFPYPSYSFMINDATWAYIGSLTAVVGLILIVASRRRAG
jgi:hypothetical protein